MAYAKSKGGSYIKEPKTPNSYRDVVIPASEIRLLKILKQKLLIAGNMDVKTISARLGHKNIQTTLNIYAHPLKKRDEEASELLDNMLNKKQRKKGGFRKEPPLYLLKIMQRFYIWFT